MLYPTRNKRYRQLGVIAVPARGKASTGCFSQTDYIKAALKIAIGRGGRVIPSRRCR